ncbi:MAG: hypothetical protein RQ745_12650 [Longimicrobiales bacterium]|nr:hypothetical protein [Longimicrobiales bacterium]
MTREAVEVYRWLWRELLRERDGAVMPSAGAFVGVATVDLLRAAELTVARVGASTLHRVRRVSRREVAAAGIRTLSTIAFSLLLFGPLTFAFVATHPSGIWLGDTDQSAIHLFDREGLSTIVRWEAEPTPRTAEDDAAYLAAIEAAAPPGTPPGMLEQVRELLIVERMPFWGRILGDDEGSLWISTTVEMGMPFQVTGPAPEREWVVLTPEGLPAATVRTPEGFEPADVRGGIVIGVERDALGVERLRAFRVVAGGAGD